MNKKNLIFARDLYEQSRIPINMHESVAYFNDSLYFLSHIVHQRGNAITVVDIKCSKNIVKFIL